jgi:hypothetical protein
MAGKAKSVYLTVCPKGKHTTVMQKVFFDAKGYSDYVKTEEFLAKYPLAEFDHVKETY